MKVYNTINQFVQINQLQSGDVLIARKPEGLLKHFVVYLGHNGLQHIFTANMSGQGVAYIPENVLIKLANEYPVESIKRFKGSYGERVQAIRRAVSAMSLNAYNLLTSNCEHYANFVQKGKFYSSQSHQAGLGIATAGVIMAASSNNDIAKVSGILMLLLGSAVLLKEGNNQ